MKQDLTRRAWLTGAGASALAAAVGSTARASGNAATETGSRQRTPRWALLVDSIKCAQKDGCRACIDACHAAHAVTAPRDPRHEVKWIWKASFESLFPEQIHPHVPKEQRSLPVLALCNHCSSPPCTRVCPTRATWQRKDGVVAMDPHRCIGCRFCMAACPYESRSFNWETPSSPARGTSYPQRSAGVVEKCTFCSERIDVGLSPLCVEACQRSGAAALTFGDLSDENAEVHQLLRTRRVLRRKPELGTLPNVYYLV
jgi:Fe-S-cluster-containing dehydrogenase component